MDEGLEQVVEIAVVSGWHEVVGGTVDVVDEPGVCWVGEEGSGDGFVSAWVEVVDRGDDVLELVEEVVGLGGVGSGWVGREGVVDPRDGALRSC